MRPCGGRRSLPPPIQLMRSERSAKHAFWRKKIRLRQQIARNAGYEHFREYRWQQLHRFDYTPADCRGQHIETCFLYAKNRTRRFSDTLLSFVRRKARSTCIARFNLSKDG